MRKNTWYVLLLLIMLVVSVVVSINAYTNDKASSSEPQIPADDVVIPQPDSGKTEADVNVSLAPSPSDNAEVTYNPNGAGNNAATPPPAATPKPTPTPTPTPEPTPTPTPTPTPIQNVSSSGSFTSDTGTGLNIRVDWVAYTKNNQLMMKVEVKASHYSFYTSSLWQSVLLRVNDAEFTSDSASVAYDGADLAYSTIATFDVPAVYGANSVDVVWDYRGSYSGISLETIEAGSVVNVE